MVIFRWKWQSMFRQIRMNSQSYLVSIIIVDVIQALCSWDISPTLYGGRYHSLLAISKYKSRVSTSPSPTGKMMITPGDFRWIFPTSQHPRHIQNSSAFSQHLPSLVICNSPMMWEEPCHVYHPKKPGNGAPILPHRWWNGDGGCGIALPTLNWHQLGIQSEIHHHLHHFPPLSSIFPTNFSMEVPEKGVPQNHPNLSGFFPNKNHDKPSKLLGFSYGFPMVWGPTPIYGTPQVSASRKCSRQ